MGIFYLDPDLGNDAGSGADWATAWKTIKLGATAARIAPNDTIKVAKSPDPVPIGNATWTNLSKTVALAAANTLTVDQCESLWTATANVTATLVSATAKQGINHAVLTVAAAFTTGKIAFHATGALNLSDYKQLSFWFRSSVLQAAGALKVCLCSDANGDVIVENFLIPGIETAQIGAWKPYCINKGSALSASIQSIAIYAVSDPGAAILMIDNVIACKDAASNDALSLCSLISKNGLGTGGAEAWYPIQSITDNVIQLDNQPATIVSAGRGYYGVTETVATYRRETFKCATVLDCTIMGSGTDGANLIQFQGGYNKTSGLQDGETFFDNGSGAGNGIDFTGKAYVLTNHINMVRALNGITFSGLTSYGCAAYGHTLCGNAGNGAYFGSVPGCAFGFKASILNGAAGLYFVTAGNNGNDVSCDLVNSNLGPGMWLAATCINNNVKTLQTCNNVGPGIQIIGANENAVKTVDSKYNTTYGVSFTTNSQRNYVEANTYGNALAGVFSDTTCKNCLRNSSIGETVKVTGWGSWLNGKVHSSYEGGNPSNNYVYMEGGYVRSQANIRYTELGIAWQLSPTSMARTKNYPIEMSLAKIAVSAGSLVTISARFRRDNVGIIGALVCRRWQLPGQDAVASYTVAEQDAWELLTISLTPSISGVIEIYAEAYGGTMYNVYVDDLSYVQ